MFYSLFQRVHHFITIKLPNLFMANNTSSGLLYNKNEKAKHLAMGMAPSTALTEERVLFADNVFVTEMKWHKRCAHPYHEFLVFTVREQGSNRKSVILLERNATEGRELKDDELKKAVDDESGGQLETDTTNGADNHSDSGTTTPPQPPASTTHSHSNRSLTSVATSVAAASARFSKNGASGDMMFFSTSGTQGFVTVRERKFDTLRTLTIDGDYVSVPQLAVLANAVHEQRVHYSLLESQCYWFAMAIYHGVMEICPAGKVTDKPNDKSFKAGKYKAFTIVKLDKLVSVKPQYEQAWKQLQETVAKMRQEEEEANRRMIDAAEQRTEQAEKRTEQAEAEARKLKREKEQQGEELRRLKEQLRAVGPKAAH